VALVTGGGQGLGKCIARAFLSADCRVVIADTDEEAGRETEQEYASVGDIRFFRTDVADESSVRDLVKRITGEHGRLDVLVNNAGIFAEDRRRLSEVSLEAWNAILGVNLTGAFLCAKHAEPWLRASCGAIVNIASTRALMSESNTFAYSASKGGIVALTHSLAVSLGPEVRVNCISPGWIEVGEWKKKSARREPQHSAADLAQHPAGRVGKPEDVANLAVFLAAPENGFITGANFMVDGGMTRKMIYAD
jgi:NAD(P)-dependent dehydrogenase (short-subunit alcohol dehydrogenase family)